MGYVRKSKKIKEQEMRNPDFEETRDMLNNRFYKLSNTFICIDFDKEMAQKINEEDHVALTTIHIFYFRHFTAVDSIKVMSEECRKRNIKMIIHCENKKKRNELRKLLKGIQKDKYFHLSAKGRPISFQINPYSNIVIDPIGSVVIREENDHTVISFGNK